MINFEIILLIICLSLDGLVASLSYGVEQIKIPYKSTFIINFINTTTFIFAMFIGQIIGDLINSNILKLISFLILFSLGLWKILEYSCKKYFTKNKNKTFKMFDIKFILQIANDSTIADKDKSKTLSSLEAISLGLALSLDGICAGLSVGLTYSNYISIFLCVFSITYTMFAIGNVIGNSLSQKRKINLSWLSGIILLILSFTKIL